jgi:hypothetical protein
MCRVRTRSDCRSIPGMSVKLLNRRFSPSIFPEAQGIPHTPLCHPSLKIFLNYDSAHQYCLKCLKCMIFRRLGQQKYHGMPLPGIGMSTPYSLVQWTCMQELGFYCRHCSSTILAGGGVYKEVHQTHSVSLLQWSAKAARRRQQSWSPDGGGRNIVTSVDKENHWGAVSPCPGLCSAVSLRL